MFEGVEIEYKPQLKLVGYIFDEKLTWAAMIDSLAKKARSRLGMLTRLRGLLDDRNMMTMYTSFIRPIMEYGSVCFMGADKVHLAKLDQIQKTAMRIGNFKAEPLAQRREAAAVALTCKLLSDRGRGILKEFKPELTDQIKVHSHDTMSDASGLQIVRKHKSNSLDIFLRSYLGCIHDVWKKIPYEVRKLGATKGWHKYRRNIKKSVVEKVINYWEVIEKGKKSDMSKNKCNDPSSKMINKVQCR